MYASISCDKNIMNKCMEGVSFENSCLVQELNCSFANSERIIGTTTMKLDKGHDILRMEIDPGNFAGTTC